MASIPINTKTRRLERADRLLYGERWQRPLSRVNGISQIAVTQLLIGDCAVTTDVERNLARAIGREVKRRCRSAKELRAVRKEIE